MTSQERAIVIGAGVSGLTSALCLRRSGRRVTILTADDPMSTTSAVAAAFWWPYDLEPVERARPWAIRSAATFLQLASLAPESGVRVRRGVVLRGDAMPWFEPLLENWSGSGPTLATPIADMPIYMSWLLRRCEQEDIDIERRIVKSLDDVDAGTIVNCAGEGARRLTNDLSVHPLRGQIVVVRGTGIETFIKDARDPQTLTYIYPRLHTVILGGTAEDSASRVPDDRITEAILDRCAALDSRVRDGEVVEVHVGLRPVRPSIRLEIEHRNDGARIVHNYGHGPAGISLSWGCAADVVRLCEQAITIPA